jgi:hypothetical protein
MMGRITMRERDGRPAGRPYEILESPRLRVKKASAPGKGEKGTLPFVLRQFDPAKEDVLPTKDGLPELKSFPAHAGGSGETMPE